MTLELLEDGPRRARRMLLLAHGAGAPMDSEFMNEIAVGVADAGMRVVRFEFPYMRRRRETGRKSPPDRMPVLQACFREAIERCGGADRMVIGGKSMGGRMASLIADEVGARGLVCLGYPFHPPGKPDRTRIEHLRDLNTPALFLQGTRDPFGKREEVCDYPLASAIELRWLEDGDHGFKPRKKSGRTLEQALSEATEATVDFVNRVSRGPR
ncbi:MAG: dienelactone hydrolase family protein [Myxococcales bacterium]|jgi:predicted alpha/beta-hydrolase family hydrolase